MKTLILYEMIGKVVDTSAIKTNDFDFQKFIDQYDLTKIEVPDNITDYYWDKYLRRIYYVIDGKIHVKHIAKRRRSKI